MDFLLPFLRARGVALLLTVAFFGLVLGAFALLIFGGMLQAYIGHHLGWTLGGARDQRSHCSSQAR